MGASLKNNHCAQVQLQNLGESVNFHYNDARSSCSSKGHWDPHGYGAPQDHSQICHSKVQVCWFWYFWHLEECQYTYNTILELSMLLNSMMKVTMSEKVRPKE